MTVTKQEQDSSEAPSLTPSDNAQQSGSINVSGDTLRALSPEELAARRDALRAMLAASEARQQDALKARRPTMVAGNVVAIRSGEHRGETGTILDADFIHSRVCLRIKDIEEPQWLEFSNVIAAPDNNAQ